MSTSGASVGAEAVPRRAEAPAGSEARPIALNALERELATATAEEAHRQRVDAMKKRAIHTATSYEEFHNMVLCADLTPVSSRELQEGLRPKPIGAAVRAAPPPEFAPATRRSVRRTDRPELR
jgi:hypothetical protein